MNGADDEDLEELDLEELPDELLRLVSGLHEEELFEELDLDIEAPAAKVETSYLSTEAAAVAAVQAVNLGQTSLYATSKAAYQTASDAAAAADAAGAAAAKVASDTAERASATAYSASTSAYQAAAYVAGYVPPPPECEQLPGCRHCQLQHAATTEFTRRILSAKNREIASLQKRVFASEERARLGEGLIELMGIEAARHAHVMSSYASQRLEAIAGAAKRSGGDQLWDGLIELIGDSAAGRVTLGGAAEEIAARERALVGSRYGTEWRHLDEAVKGVNQSLRRLEQGQSEAREELAAKRFLYTTGCQQASEWSDRRRSEARRGGMCGKWEPLWHAGRELLRLRRELSCCHRRLASSDRLVKALNGEVLAVEGAFSAQTRERRSEQSLLETVTVSPPMCELQLNLALSTNLPEARAAAASLVVLLRRGNETCEMMMGADAAGVLSKLLESDDGSLLCAALGCIALLARTAGHVELLAEEGVWEEVLEILDKVPQEASLSPPPPTPPKGREPSKSISGTVTNAVGAGGEAILDLGEGGIKIIGAALGGAEGPGSPGRLPPLLPYMDT